MTVIKTRKNRTRHSKVKKSRRRQSRKRQRGGLRKWVFLVERVHDVFLPIFADGQGLLPDNMSGLSPDNTHVSEREIELAGSAAGGSEDACKFVLNPLTGKITFEEVGEPDDEGVGNLWVTNHEDIITVLQGYRERKEEQT